MIQLYLWVTVRVKVISKSIDRVFFITSKELWEDVYQLLIQLYGIIYLPQHDIIITTQSFLVILDSFSPAVSSFGGYLRIG